MAKVAADPGAFERRLKERLEQMLVGRRRFQAHHNDGVWVEEVRLDGSYPDTTGAIILRDDRQRGCRFAWRLGELWDWRSFKMTGADPHEQTNWIVLNLDEDVEAVNYGIPIRCLEGEVTFMGKTQMSLTEAVRRGPLSCRSAYASPSYERAASLLRGAAPVPAVRDARSRVSVS